VLTRGDLVARDTQPAGRFFVTLQYRPGKFSSLREDSRSFDIRLFSDKLSAAQAGRSTGHPFFVHSLDDCV
jgi:hypothetical protein